MVENAWRDTSFSSFLLNHTNLEKKIKKMFVLLIKSPLTHVCMKENICVHWVVSESQPKMLTKSREVYYRKQERCF